MSTPILNQTTNKAGLCPHGLPPAACPICSQKMAGGAGKMRDNTVSKPKPSNEWSWLKCYAVGLRMKAQEAREQNAKTAFERQIEFAHKLSKNIQNIADKIRNTLSQIQNTLPNIISKPIGIVINIIISPLINILMQIPKIIEKFAQIQKNISEFLIQITEKLTAIFGDIKNFLNRKLSEKLKKITKNFFLFFMPDIEDENYKNDDILAVFKSRELKKYLLQIPKLIKRRDKDANRSIKNKSNKN